MIRSKPSLLLVVVVLVLFAGAVVYLRLPSPPVSAPASMPSVDRLSEVEVNLPEEKRTKYEQEIADFSTQISTKEAAGEYVLDVYFLRGGDYQRLGKLALAFSDYSVVTAGDPGNETAWNNLGVIVEDMGDPAAAEVYYVKAIEQDPSEVAYNKLYRYYETYQKENDQQMIDLLQKALSDNPSSTSFNVKLGRLYFERGDKEQAVAAFRQAAVLSPDNSAIQDELRQALAL